MYSLDSSDCCEFRVEGLVGVTACLEEHLEPLEAPQNVTNTSHTSPKTTQMEGRNTPIRCISDIHI